MKKAHPPRNAPTGLRAGSGAASANRRADVWKLRAGAAVAAKGEAAARDTERRSIVLEAIVMLKS